jgi:DNA-binding transcriptional MerR regulator
LTLPWGETSKCRDERSRILRPRPPVTVKTLQRDLEHLEQIVALKFLGLRLKQIRSILERGELGLVDALCMQRQVIEGEQRLLTRAIRPGEATDPEVLKRLIGMIKMQDAFSEDALSNFTALYELMRSEEWRSLIGILQPRWAKSRLARTPKPWPCVGKR